MTDDARRAVGRLVATCGGLLLAMLAAVAPRADDTEIFVFDPGAIGVRPNVLLIVDTSSSMQQAMPGRAPYDALATYPGACHTDRLYWRRGTGAPPTCTSDHWLEIDFNRCAAALPAALRAGYLTDRFAAFDATRAVWTELSTSAQRSEIECQDDRGLHGPDALSADVYAQDGDAAAAWTDDLAAEIDWLRIAPSTVYSGNYLNWISSPLQASTRLDVVKEWVARLIANSDGMNVGLMRLNDSAGGSVVLPVEDVESQRNRLFDTVAALNASGAAPSTGALYEAALYFRGAPPVFGTSGIGVVDGLYQSPIDAACQSNHIVYVSDGEPDEDPAIEASIAALPGFADRLGTACDGGPDACLDDLAEYLRIVDVDPRQAGHQSVVTHTVSFTPDALLESAARRGGGTYTSVTDEASLIDALTGIAFAVTAGQTSFATPVIPIDRSDPMRHADAAYVPVFTPTSMARWSGNLKKYRLRADDGTIVDAQGRLVVDPLTGLFLPDSQSLWSDEADGFAAAAGGAAGRLPEPDARRVFTYLGDPDLTASSNAVTAANVLLDAARLGIGNPGDPGPAEVIAFIRGRDVGDADLDGDATEVRDIIADPLHSRPVVLPATEDPDAGQQDEAVVFIGTNDGYLHAFDAATGRERWAFLAPEFLPDQADLLDPSSARSKQYGIDGPLRLLRIGPNDGSAAGAEARTLLFFGLRRGGDAYYALDVTNPAAPRVAWRHDASTLPGLGQTWSAPIPTRIDVGGAEQNEADLVVTFGGGYDPSQDRVPASTDKRGNSLYVVDALSGKLLWRGSGSGATANFPAMRYSIPADLRVIDLSGDGYADRIYAADMGAQVWRFDVHNGSAGADLVTGGVMAALGDPEPASASLAEARRFYYAPDAAFVDAGAESYISIGIGSGYRAHPNSFAHADQFFALRDRIPFASLSQAEFDVFRPATVSDLADVTDQIGAIVTPREAGWRIRLEEGEKVLSEARTFNGRIYFATYRPAAGPTADCTPATATLRLYTVKLANGAPAQSAGAASDVSDASPTDRWREINGSIPGEAIFVFPPPISATEQCSGMSCRVPPVVCQGLACSPTDFDNSPVRTVWRQLDVDR